MSAERDELAGVAYGAMFPASREEPATWTPSLFLVAAAILAAGYRKPRTITTAEELDALPTDSTVRSSDGGVWFKETSGSGSNWTEPGAQWWHFASDISLPATVLYDPEAQP